MSLETPNGKVSLRDLALIATFVGGFWVLIQGEFRHINKEVDNMDIRLQREMRLLNETLSESARGNDRQSLDRHNFQELEIRELKEQLKDFKRK